MSLKRIGANVAFGLYLLITATPAFSQGLRGMQLFDTPDMTTVGRGQKPNEGFFVSYDGLYWNISPPDTAIVGDAGSRQVFYGPHPLDDRDIESDMGIQVSTLDTSQLSGWQTSNWVGGQRVELGRISDGHGWLLSFTELQNQTQAFLAQNVNMVLADPDFDQQGHSSLQGIVGTIPNPDPLEADINIVKNLPITFSNVQVINNTGYWSIEWMYAGRSQEIGEGGYLEWYAGPRYTELNDTFLVNANGGNLDATNWATDAQNHIVAGQMGVRYFEKGRPLDVQHGRPLLRRFELPEYPSVRRYRLEFESARRTLPALDPGPRRLQPCRFYPRDHSRRRIAIGTPLCNDAATYTFRAGWSGTWME